jgi:hypothetical protein
VPGARWFGSSGCSPWLLLTKPPNPSAQIQPPNLTKCTLANDGCVRGALAPTQGSLSPHCEAGGRRRRGRLLILQLPKPSILGRLLRSPFREVGGAARTAGLSQVLVSCGQSEAQTCRTPPASTVTTEGESRAPRSNPLKKPPPSFCS